MDADASLFAEPFPSSSWHAPWQPPPSPSPSPAATSRTRGPGAGQKLPSPAHSRLSPAARPPARFLPSPLVGAPCRLVQAAHPHASSPSERRTTVAVARLRSAKGRAGAQPPSAGAAPPHPPSPPPPVGDVASHRSARLGFFSAGVIRRDQRMMTGKRPCFPILTCLPHAGDKSTFLLASSVAPSRFALADVPHRST